MTSHNENMISVNATEFKAKCLQYLDDVRDDGQIVIVTKHGKEVAKLVPVNTPERPKVKAGFMKDRMTITGDIMEPFTEEWEQHDLWF